MFEIVAHEDDVEVVGRCDFGQRQSISLDEPDLVGHAAGGIAEIGGPPLGGLDVADEGSGIGADVEDP
jgi:hypothetical protein